MSAHTPGPWRVISRTDIDGEPVTYVGQPERRGIDGHDYSLTWAENDVARVFGAADARLIAAAPALLEALEGIISVGKRDMSNPKYDTYFVSARAAIAQAKGENNG